jgi:hypothetical protein
MELLEWNDYDIKDSLKIQKSYGYFFKCYMKSKGFIAKDSTFFLKDRPKDMIIIDNFATIGIRYISYSDNSQMKKILLHRYVLYPQVIDAFSISIPNPDWGYGFLEVMIKTLDNFLLDDIFNKNGVYNEVLNESNTYIQLLQSQPYKVHTGEMTQKENQKMLQIPFTSTYLSYEKYKNKENPYKVKK